jgi:hypothetical protein
MAMLERDCSNLSYLYRPGMDSSQSRLADIWELEVLITETLLAIVICTAYL